MTTSILRRGLGLLPLCLLVAGAQASTDDDDWPDWVDRHEEQIYARIAAVNEGDLRFLTDRPDKPVHHHASRVEISEQSLRDGWVLMEQCHRNLDKVGALQIVFNKERSRELEILRHRNIDRAYTTEHTVQLRGINADSEVCIRAESRALNVDDGAVFELNNGPFMRRFLDGYYPLQLSLRIDYPESLELADFSPEAQPGFDVDTQPGRVAVETLFEGELRTRFRFLGD